MVQYVQRVKTPKILVSIASGSSFVPSISTLITTIPFYVSLTITFVLVSRVDVKRGRQWSFDFHLTPQTEPQTSRGDGL